VVVACISMIESSRCFFEEAGILPVEGGVIWTN
jgi:hypothetical protein